jgi:hypothetical protein
VIGLPSECRSVDDPSGALFTLLLTENLKSLAARYGDEGAIEGHKHHLFLSVPLPPLTVIKLAQSYRYQSCEHDGWEGSTAEVWTARLIASLIHKLPGYDETPWFI